MTPEPPQVGSGRSGTGRKTIVSFHAHPDDEALLTGGTLAMLAAAGHRVVLVTATAGALGLTESGVAPQALADRRRDELERSAAALGCARVEILGFGDSGWSTQRDYPPAPGSFATVAVDDAATALADILRDERADVLTSYDRNGGYGHVDHIRVHTVAAAAARMAGVERVLEATLDRTVLRRGVRALQASRMVPQGAVLNRLDAWFSSRTEITHRVDVSAFCEQKRSALAAHASQAVGGGGPRTAAILLGLPRPVFARVCGTEWFVESGAPVPVTPLPDPLLDAHVEVGSTA